MPRARRLSPLRRAWVFAVCALIALVAPATSARASAWGPDHASVDPIVWAVDTSAPGTAGATAPDSTPARAVRTDLSARARATLGQPARSPGSVDPISRARGRLYLLHEALLR